MTLQGLLDIVLGIVLVGWICWRQLTWRAVDIARMLRMPLVLGVVGVVMLGRVGVHPLSGWDIALLAAELAVSAGTGAAMGALARFRPASVASAARAAARRRGGAPHPPVVFDTRTGWLGIALWAVLIAARIGMDAAATAAGSPLATATGMILVVVAVNRATRVAVIARRARLRHPVAVPV